MEEYPSCSTCKSYNEEGDWCEAYSCPVDTDIIDSPCDEFETKEETT